MFNGFRNFIFRGNVIDLAVAVVIGTAFNGIVNALVKDLITPLLGILGGQPDFSKIYFTINNSKFLVGDFLNSLISFLSISLVIYFGIVLPMNKLNERTKKKEIVEDTEKVCEQCLSKIPKEAKRCKFCTAQV